MYRITVLLIILLDFYLSVEALCTAYDSINEECGLLDEQHESMGSDVVVAQAQNWPYLVSIQIALDDIQGDCFEHICGGVLIQDDTVLTVASCMKQFMDASNTQLIQIVYVSLAPQCRHQSGRDGRVEVQNIELHPQWNIRPGAYDAALLTLQTPFKNPQTISPSLSHNISLEEGLKLQFSGYGYISLEDKKQYSVELLRSGGVKFIGESTCQILLGFYGGGANLTGLLDYSVMGCAYNPRADSCGGDYGGPVVIKGDSPSEDILIGLLSWGPALQCRSEEDSQAPIVFTDVASLIPWLQKNSLEQTTPPCSDDLQGCNEEISMRTASLIGDTNCFDTSCNTMDINLVQRYPYQVSLLKTSNDDDEECFQYLCDGVLVGSDAVVTSAYCVANILQLNEDQKDIEIASLSVAIMAQCEEQQGQQGLTSVKEVIIHPSFDDKDGKDSLALLILEEEFLNVTQIQYKKALFLNAQGNIDYQIVGYSQKDLSTGVKESQLESISESNCNLLLDLYYGSSNEARMLNYDSHICAIDSRADQCIGSQGSPAIFKGDSAADDVLIGIASWGPGLECFAQRADQSPFVFTRIIHYVDWISASIEQEQQNDQAAVIVPQRIFSLQNPQQGTQDPCSSKKRRSLLGIIEKDDRTPISSTFCYPFSAIGVIGNCTGSMISPLHVLTAGHCLANLENGNALHKKNQLIFVSGANGYQKTEQSKVLRYGIPQQMLENLDFSYDIGIATLEKPIGFETGWLGIIPQSFTASGSQVNIVGYPLEFGNYLPYNSKCILGVEKGSKNETRHSCDTSRGMGGAPLFVVNSQKQSDAFIVAVHTLFEKDPGQNHAALMTEDLIQYIQDYINQDI